MPVREWMTPQQRVLAAVKLEPYDRVPVVPLLDFSFPVKHKGLSLAQGIADYSGLGWPAIVDLFNEVGGWDGFILPGWSQTPNPNHPYSGKSNVVKLPGRGLPENAMPQFVEAESMTHRDYNSIIKLGWNRWSEKVQQKNSKIPPEKVITWAERQIAQYRQEVQTWGKRGIPVLVGAVTSAPLMTLSTARSMRNFALDIRRIPDKVQAVMDAMTDDFINNAIEVTRLTGVPGVALIQERGGASYFPLKIFERFGIPYIKKMVSAFASQNIITVLHLDQDWTLNLPYFRELPARMCVCELDGKTNIFEAGQILKNHMCIAGDVSASLSVNGTPADIEEYCKNLIDKLSKETGFMLSTGCTFPPDGKFENFKMMIRTAKDYYPYARRPPPKIY
ncbi:MAG: uroporphyrinogen decarboxylase family protein [Dehalococcoidales bacterium]|nr:uroporphyrinogen decarboxylase family protein [Dehalococcoidales bacterium]